MDIFVALISALVTLAILNNSKIDKTSSQLMLLGLELTIIGAVLILITVFTSSNTTLFLMGIAIAVIGLIVNLFGFGKK